MEGTGPNLSLPNVTQLEELLIINPLANKLRGVIVILTKPGQSWMIEGHGAFSHISKQRYK